MTYPAWPAFFPAPQIDGYEIQMGDVNNIRSTSDWGPPQTRNRMRRQTATIPVVWVLTDDQMTLFESYWKYTLHDGASWFTSKQDGEDLQDNTCRFIGGYEAKLATLGYWTVTGALEIDDPYRSE
jgi:hypothetical protein